MPAIHPGPPSCIRVFPYLLCCHHPAPSFGAVKPAPPLWRYHVICSGHRGGALEQSGNSRDKQKGSRDDHGPPGYILRKPHAQNFKLWSFQGPRERTCREERLYIKKAKSLAKTGGRPDLLTPEELLCCRAGLGTAQGGGIIHTMKGSQFPKHLGVATLSGSSTSLGATLKSLVGGLGAPAPHQSISS